MRKLLAGIFLGGMIAVTAGLASAGCTSTTANFVTGCTTYTPDAGFNALCAIGWSCSSTDTTYQMICTAAEEPENYNCACSDGDSTTVTMNIVVNTFICDAQGALSTANMGCNFNIQQ